MTLITVLLITGGIVVFYLLGCLLAYLKFTGTHYGIMEELIGKRLVVPWWEDDEPMPSPSKKIKSWEDLGYYIVSRSWYGFYKGVENYFDCGGDEPYFFKWSYKKLIQRQDDQINFMDQQLESSAKDILSQSDEW